MKTKTKQLQPPNEVSSGPRSLQNVVSDEIERRKREDKKAADIFLDLMAWEDRQAQIGNKICLIFAGIVILGLCVYVVLHYL